MLYEAIQTSIKAAQSRGDKEGFIDEEEVMRHLAIHKRSINDRSRASSLDELIEQILVLAGQKLPLIYILRQIIPKGNTITFRSSLVAPSDKHPNKVLMACKRSVEQITSSLQNIRSEAFLKQSLNNLRTSLASSSPEPRIGRVDYELRKIYIPEDSTSSTIPDIKQCIRRVNQNIYDKLYYPVILSGVKNKSLASLNCEDMRSANNQDIKQLSDIVHFADANHLKERFKVLCEFCNSSFFGGWWPENEAIKLKEALDNKEITAANYYGSSAQAVIHKLQGNINEVTMPLLFLAVEVHKLNQWLHNYDINRQKEQKQTQLNNIATQLRSASNLYQLRDMEWLTENKQLVHSILCGKINGLLGCTYPYYNPFQITSGFDPKALHADFYLITKDKKTTANAIQSAVRLYREAHDVTLLRVLENIFQIFTVSNAELREYIAPVYLNSLWETVKHSYLKHLPWWSRMLHKILGKELSTDRLKRFRGRVEMTQRRQAMHRLAQAAKTTDSLRKRDDLSTPNREQRPPAEVDEDAISEEQKALTRETCAYLDKQWAEHRYPQREDLMKMAGDKRDIMKKILTMVNLDTLSVRDIVTIPIHGMDQIYASRSYLKAHKLNLIHRLTEKEREEATYTIGDKTFISTEVKSKFLYKGIIDFLKSEIR